MQKYQVIEHFDHCQPPVERIRIVEASGPMEAIRSRPFWKHASRFTSVDGGVSLYTQDRDGVNGCKSTPAISSEVFVIRRGSAEISRHKTEKAARAAWHKLVYNSKNPAAFSVVKEENGPVDLAVCRGCGYEREGGEAPETCPECGHLDFEI